MPILKGCILSLMLFFGTSKVLAQIPTQLQFKHLSVESGLPSSFVSCLYKDKKGFLWIGTHSGGIARFDGQRVKNYPIDGVNEVINFIEDKEQNLYAGTNAGLFLLKKEATRFQKVIIPHVKEEESGCWTNPVYIDNEGKMWLTFTCEWGLYTFDFNTQNLTKVIDTLAERLRIYPIEPFKKVEWCMSVASEGLTLTYFQNDKAIRTEHVLKGLKNIPKISAASNFTAENDSIIWLGATQGLVRFNRKTNELKVFNRFNGKIITNLARPIIVNSGTGTVAVGSEADGLLFFDKNKMQFTQQLTYHATMPKGLSSNNLDDVFVDSLNNIFAIVPTYGIDYASLNTPFFENIFTKKEAFQNGFISNEIACTVQNKNGEIYLGTKTNGIAIVSKNQNLRLFPFNNQLLNRTVNTICFTNTEGSMLVGTNGGLQFFRNGSAQNILQHEIVNNISQYDASTFFISTFNNLYSLQILGSNYILKPVKGVAENAHRYNWNVFFTEKHEPIALLEYGSLIAALEFQNGNWQMGRMKWLPMIVVNDTPSVKNNIATFCTFQGLLKVDLLGFSWVLQKAMNKVPLNQILKNFTISDKESWIITETRFSHILNNKVTHYTTSDGLSSNSFEAKACIALQNGDLFLAGNNGGNIFKMNVEKPIKSKSQVIFSDIFINDTAEIQLKDSILNLPFTKNTITISLTHTDFTLPNSNVIEYRLRNFDANWLPSLPNASIRYGNLPEGEYVFEVREIDQEQILNNFTIRITPPFWRTWWFRGLAFTAIFVGIWAYLRWYLKQIKKEEQQKTELERLKIEAETKALRAQMNPHFIFNCINTVDGYIVTNRPVQASSFLQKFSKLIRLVLENSQHEKILIKDDVQALELYLQLENERFGRAFNYEINTDDSIIKENYCIVPLLIQPFIENAILHGLRHKTDEKGSVKLYFKDDNQLIKIIIDDNGVGREKAQFYKNNMVNVHKSMGLQVTLDRLKSIELEYRYDANFTIIDKQQGTQVAFFIPKIKASEMTT